MTSELRKRARALLVDRVRSQILVLNRDHGHAITSEQATERARNIVAGINEIFDIACEEAGDDIVAGLVGLVGVGVTPPIKAACDHEWSVDEQGTRRCIGCGEPRW